MAALGAHNPTNRIVQRRPLKNSLESRVQLHHTTPNPKAKILFVGQSKKRDRIKIATKNLILQNREARHSAPSEINSPLKTQWAAISAAREFVGKKEKSFITEYIYNYARTYFIKNSWEKQLPAPQKRGGAKTKQKNRLAGKKFPPLKPLHFLPVR